MSKENKAPSNSRGSQRARLGLPAKAGRRKVYGKGKRKMAKEWGQGNGFMMTKEVKAGSPGMWEDIRRARLVMPARVKEVLDRTIRNPWDRMQAKAHWHAGILDL